MNRKNNKEHKIFVGRTNELNDLERLAKSRRSVMIVIKGRRRIGKSCLVAEFARNKVFLPFAGLSPVDGITAQDQRDAFARQLSFLFHLPPLSFSDWLDGFAHLTRHLEDRKTVILFDEISWMSSKDPTFLPKLKLWWDQISAQKTNLILFLCGSVSSWIENNILKSTAFFGRVSLNMTLEGLSLAESHQFLRAIGVQASAYDIFRVLSITGGVPWYLENIQADQPLDENIKWLCFSPNGLLVQEFDLIFHDLFERRGDIYKKIIVMLAEGMKDYAQIRESLRYAEGGGVAPYLDTLIESGYVTKHQSWSIKTGKLGTKSLFRLSDNYLRFYLKVIAPLKEKIQLNAFQDMPVSAIPGWSSLMGFQIENLLLANRKLIHKSLGIHPQDIIADNPFQQRQTKTQAGVQIDYLIQTATKTLYLCEFKFNRNELKQEIIKETQIKVEKLSRPRGFSVCPVLLHMGGVADTVLDARYFYRIIDISDFLYD